MNNSFLAWLKRHPVMAYFILAYVISWSFEIPLAAIRQEWVQFSLPFAIHYLASAGPILSALIITALTQGRSGIRELFVGLFKWRVGIGWYLISAVSPIALFAIAAIVQRATGGQWPDLYLIGEVDYLPYLGVAGALILWLLTYGLCEEVGWRGFALPRLQKSRSALSASLILGVFWTFWHLPAFFYKDTYMAMGLATGLPMLLLSVLAAAIVFTWIFNGTRGSLLMVILFHGIFDLLSVSKAGGSYTAAIMSAVPMIWAVIVVLLYKPATLSPAEKVVA